MSTIAHVVEATATGTLSMVCTSANLLAEDGHNVHIIYSVRSETPSDFLGLFHDSIILHKVQMNWKNGMVSLPILRKLLTQMEPDIVHLHSSFAGFYGRVALLGALPSTRIFYSPHCISVMREDIRFRKYAFAALERLAGIRDCTYVACSESERQAITRWVGKESVLLENAVDFNFLNSNFPLIAESDNGEVPFTVITVGGIRAQKNPMLFAEICENSKRIGIDAHFIWVGDGDEDLASRLRQSGVNVTGWKTRSQVVTLLAQSHIYLSTSTWEGMPVSVIEAMASKSLVLATRCSGNVDIIDNQVTGLLFDTATEACEAIKRVMHGVTDTHAIIDKARASVLARFSTKSYFSQLQKIYFS